MSNIPDRLPGIKPLFPARRIRTAPNPARRDGRHTRQPSGVNTPRDERVGIVIPERPNYLRNCQLFRHPFFSAAGYTDRWSAARSASAAHCWRAFRVWLQQGADLAQHPDARRERVAVTLDDVEFGDQALGLFVDEVQVQRGSGDVVAKFLANPDMPITLATTMFVRFANRRAGCSSASSRPAARTARSADRLDTQPQGSVSPQRMPCT